MKKEIFTCLALACCVQGFSQTDSISLDSVENHRIIVPTPAVQSSKIYRLKPAVDIPLTAVTAGWSIYAFPIIYSKDTSTTAQILALNKKDLAAINRHGVKHYSENAKNTSDYLFYGAMPLPLILLVDKEIRKDAARVGFLYLEAMSVTGILYTGAAYVKDKYRPYAYNPEVPIEKRKAGGAKNSFFGGHPALVGTSTFFIAKVYSDYHPESRIKWVLYSAAGAATLATSYLRYKGGLHFTTDLIIGTAIGPLSGILVPHFHKVKKDKGAGLGLTPYYNGQAQGFALTYRF